MHGGKAFVKPLPFVLGTNDSSIPYGFTSGGIAAAQSIGMTWYRSGLPWNSTVGTWTGLTSAPGVYNATNIALMASQVATLKAAGMNQLFVITSQIAPGLCPTLGAPLTSGTVYTSINVTNIPFAITSGDFIVLTNPANQSQTQTVVAAASMAYYGSGSLAVTSFTANNNYASGAWVYDTTWVPCTPQHFASTMAHVVAQSGLQGLHWELLNEPDGSQWSVSPTLLTQMFQLAYPAMKSADPTCTIHASATENFSLVNGGQGILYLNACYSALPTWFNYYDVGGLHCYTPDPTYSFNIAPNAIGAYGVEVWKGVANFQHARVAAGDTKPLWITEFGFPTAGGTGQTPASQAQWYQDLLLSISGNDPINNVAFYSYLKAIFNYAMGTGGANWGIVGEPAVAVLTDVVRGY